MASQEESLRVMLENDPNGPVSPPKKPPASGEPGKCRNFHHALAAEGGGRVVRMGTIPSLDRFQAQVIWEMSAKRKLTCGSAYQGHD